MRAQPLSLWNSAQPWSLAKSQVEERVLSVKNFRVAEKPKRDSCRWVEKVVEKA